MNEYNTHLEMLRNGWTILTEREVIKRSNSRMILVPELQEGNKVKIIVIPKYENKYKDLENNKYKNCNHCNKLITTQTTTCKYCYQKT